jgi:hypothetical protein
MTAHQRHAALPETFREVARLSHVGNEQVGVAELIGDVPDRHLDADKASRMGSPAGALSPGKCRRAAARCGASSGGTDVG